MINIAIHGAAGRMGRRLLALTVEDENLNLAAAVENPGNPLLGQDAGELAGTAPTGIKLTDQYIGQADILIDFTVPAAFRTILNQCVEHKTAIVIGTTGLSAEDQQAINDAAKVIPVVQAPNYNLGVNLLFALAAKAAKTLGDDYDIEILEAHHRFKMDAPSGTAMGLAEAICDATDKDVDKTLRYERAGNECPRQRGEITMQTLRIGDCFGEHTAYFAALGERLELKHITTNRDSLVRGALHAAKWVDGKSAGRYSMMEILGL